VQTHLAYRERGQLEHVVERQEHFGGGEEGAAVCDEDGAEEGHVFGEALQEEARGVRGGGKGVERATNAVGR
jgi:hypothetical protein